MQIRGEFHFWDDGVACFCHENLARALHRAFGEAAIDMTDLSYEKYSRVAEHSRVANSPKLERSAWFEYLRSGPRHRFTIASGVTGVFSRYSIEFEISESLVDTEAPKVRHFLENLHLGPLTIAEKPHRESAGVI